MKILLQRVKEASVVVACERRSIVTGVVLLVGIAPTDTKEQLLWCMNKIMSLELWDGQNIADKKADILIVSQFTLYANVRKGKKPSFSNAAKPELAETLYNEFVALCKGRYTGNIQTGIFGADMQVHLQNDGPYTLLIEKEV